MSKDLDKETMRMLEDEGLASSARLSKQRNTKGMPYTTTGVPNLSVHDLDSLSGTNTRGLIFSSPRLKNETQNRTMSPAVFVSPEADNRTVAHETEHLLARQNLGFPQMTRDTFIELLHPNVSKANKMVPVFLDGLKESLPYLKEKYGIKSGYMTPSFIDKQGRTGLYEIFAELAATEAALGVDLTKDPELRKTMFKDRNVREAYNAVTGLRQTRMDARDLKPYTRLSEEPEKPGLTDKVKKLMGFANGGMVPTAGNKKLI